jgi:hypothetical protein
MLAMSAVGHGMSAFLNEKLYFKRTVEKLFLENFWTFA